MTKANILRRTSWVAVLATVFLSVGQADDVVVVFINRVARFGCDPIGFLRADLQVVALARQPDSPQSGAA